MRGDEDAGDAGAEGRDIREICEKTGAPTKKGGARADLATEGGAAPGGLFCEGGGAKDAVFDA